MTDQEAIEYIKGLRALLIAGPEAEQACDIAVRAIETLAWFNAREPYFRAMVGAVEDAGVFRDEAQNEWRLLVDWEMENRKP